ncbi:alpha-(1,6)-fucosyltransferase-like [Acyrthosiphon pisum]|uniref:GT23 domain-containing protein n=1 Tax=Acyrthosiphon pisum TaxID=7029 RepID=A0A8R2NP43_ACYPI|nr:alpha-(1,6)-fucosyltransferase-like [Acyrthosiphon pisum]XP_029342405.1 alpha-(1,6)-fucosyltransferase-like [Acyrthosiphon pisum]XP_029342406.1 alpha-(1,6)-fucosyltransferase-like [Acyrthosiphon pisum]
MKSTMNIMKMIKCYLQFWKRIFMFSFLVLVVLFYVTFYFNCKKTFTDDLEQTFAISLEHLDEERRINIELTEIRNDLIQKLRFDEKNMKNTSKMLYVPSEEYELLRRRIYSNTKEVWYYVSSTLRSLANEFDDLKPNVSDMKTMVDEHYRSLLRDVAKLVDVDGYSQWRLKEFGSLSRLVQKRLQHTQNPPDCSKAKKLLCNFVYANWCGFGCRVHHFVKCLFVAYATERTMIIDNPGNWRFTSGGFEKLFLPLSDTCTSKDGETFSHWPGNETTQVIMYDLPTSDNADKHLNHLYLPVVLPEDLAERINVLHGDPAVWWIGQFFKYIFRPQPFITNAFNEFAKRVRFQKPIVGLHIRRSDKLIKEASLHKLEEYMYHVEEYYKLKELDGVNDTKRIYLATDDPTLFDEARLKYPEYDIIGDPEISKSASTQKRELDGSVININIEIYFLAHCDYVVCTFSSNVCRLAYEIMNSLQPDASAKFTSLDDTFYFHSQVHRLNVALLSHKSEGPGEMDLEVGDEIEEAGNNWDGYSKGTNLRTKKTLLYPTFKVTRKIEVLPFASYPNITMNNEVQKEENF